MQTHHSFRSRGATHQPGRSLQLWTNAARFLNLTHHIEISLGLKWQTPLLLFSMKNHWDSLSQFLWSFFDAFVPLDSCYIRILQIYHCITPGLVCINVLATQAAAWAANATYLSLFLLHPSLWHPRINLTLQRFIHLRVTCGCHMLPVKRLYSYVGGSWQLWYLILLIVVAAQKIWQILKLSLFVDTL